MLYFYEKNNLFIKLLAIATIWRQYIVVVELNLKNNGILICF